MRARNNNNGYNAETYNEQTAGVIPQILIGSGPQEKREYDEESKQYTNNIISVEIDVYYPGLGVQVVKLPKDFKMPKDLEDLSEVELIEPEACVVNRRVYVRAKGIK